MKKDLKDYLHLYLGCECIYDWPYTMEFNLEGKVTAKIIEEINSPKLTGAVTNVKPILRPLSDMTNEELEFLYYLSEGILDYQKQEVKRMSTNEIYLRFGKYSEKIFGYFKLTDADERTNSGISFYVRNYQINESLVVDQTGIKNYENHFNKELAVIAGNQSEIFFHLLSKHFDLFGLIESGLAIDKTKIKNNE